MRLTPFIQTLFVTSERYVCKYIGIYLEMSIIMHMKNHSGKAKRILELAHHSGVVSTGEVRSRGLHHQYLRQLCKESKLVRVGRGIYSLPDGDVTIHHGLVQAAKAIPKGVICLLSALRFYECAPGRVDLWLIWIDRNPAHDHTGEAGHLGKFSAFVKKWLIRQESA